MLIVSAEVNSGINTLTKYVLGDWAYSVGRNNPFLLQGMGLSAPGGREDCAEDFSENLVLLELAEGEL